MNDLSWHLKSNSWVATFKFLAIQVSIEKRFFAEEGSINKTFDLIHASVLRQSKIPKKTT